LATRECDKMLRKISFISCVNDFDLYNRCVAHSLKKQRTTVEMEFLTVDNTRGGWSCPAALNHGLEKAKGEIIVFCHQDIIFPSWWMQQLLSQINIVGGLCDKWGVLGLAGCAFDGAYSGHVIDKWGHFHSSPLPMEIQSLDELCLIIRRESGLRFDEDIGGFHFYAADICLESLCKGLTNFAIDACVKHLGKGERGDGFYLTQKRLSDKWRRRISPIKVIHTPSAVVILQPGLKPLLRFILIKLNLRFKHIIKKMISLNEKELQIPQNDIDIESVGYAPRYYELFHPDVISAVPPDAKVALSVGCAAGRTEAELVKRGIKVVGVEINHDAAEIARQRGLHILEGDVSEVEVDINEGLYDFIIYADILEHLPDPVNILRRHLKYLKPGGGVFVSIPNFRHYSVFWKLFMQGQIKYEDAGILDRTHLRITTRRMVLDWFDKVGLIPVSCNYNIFGRRNKLLSLCSLGLAKEFIAHHISCLGKKP
jgi:2-polyprenyl-3-methyl-5-hydroxy-6-metoxy-1,4-benzoquinol methylase